MNIFKYRTNITDYISLEIPGPIKLLDCEAGGGEIIFWILVDKDKPVETVELCVVGTGHHIDIDFLDKWDYWKTVRDMIFVWHIFVKRQKGKGGL
jgi:hypothetical protein